MYSLNYFSNKSEVKDLSSSDESEEEDEDNIASFKDYLNEDDTKQVYGDGNRIIYKCLIKYIVEAIKADEIIYSENNRMIDLERLKTFTNFESTKCDPIILGEYKGTDSKYQIIDGQHRLTFLKNIDLLDPYVKNRILNEYIPLDVRICKDDNDFKSYIDSTNNRKNFSSDQLRANKYPLLRELLNKEFKNALFTISYIKINEDTFKSELFKTQYFENFNNTVEMLFDKITKINKFFKNLEDKSKLSTDKNMTKKSHVDKRVKAEKENLFLGLDVKLKWISLLDHDESLWHDTWISFFSIKKLKK